MFKVKDCADEELVSTFYGPELTKVEGADEGLYRVERVLGEKVGNGV